MFVSEVKYLGLLAMSKILKTHPKSVQSHKDLILQCLDDKDESIRLRALDLLYGMVRYFCFYANLNLFLLILISYFQLVALSIDYKMLSAHPGVQEEPDGDREEADAARGQSGRNHLQRRAAHQDHRHLQPEQLPVHHQLRMVLSCSVRIPTSL